MATCAQRLNVLSLCSGIGGLDLGITLAEPSARTVCAVEGEAYAAAILAARMEEGHMGQAPIWSDLRTFDGKPWCGVVDCLAAGWPCQPHSSCGKQRGADDPRYLWPEVLRVLEECGAPLVFFENVRGMVTRGLQQVLKDLAGLGFHGAEWDMFSAEEEGAPHCRERVFVFAYADHERFKAIRARAEAPGGPEPLPSGGWSSGGGMGRMASRTPNRVDRLRALGNSVCPATAARAWRELTTRAAR